MTPISAWAIAMTALAMVHTPAEAAQFPEKAIRLLVPFAPGILGTPEIRERFAALGAEVQPSTTEELGRFIREDLAQWVKVVKQAGIKLEL